MRSQRSKISEVVVSSVIGKTQRFCQSAVYKGNQIAVRSLQRKQVASLTSKQELKLAKVNTKHQEGKKESGLLFDSLSISGPLWHIYFCSKYNSKSM